MNKKRFSATLVNNTLRFVLNIPVKGMEKTVTTIGGCSGYEVDKWQQLANLITPCDIGWNPLTNNEPNIGIDQCAAHLRCVVNKIDPDSNGGHNLLHCTIEEAFVKKEYWDGKNFAPTNANVPPYLTFFGSQRFGYVTTDE
jgi:flavin reductase (DIM6/NTAB) family NADH-FMN oxidoreductase RutF